MTSLVINVPSEYISLGLVLQDALEQASRGKGKERHASEGEAYEDQIICEVTRRLGSGYPLGQAVKKIYESQRIGGERGIAELLGAINYIAAAVIVAREELEAEREEDKRDHEFLNSVFAPYAEKPKAEAENRHEFKEGEAVQYTYQDPSDPDAVWMEAKYVHSFCQRGHHVLNSGGMNNFVHPENQIRRAPKPEFKHGDLVEYSVVLPSVSDRLWRDAVYDHLLPHGAGHMVRTEEGELRAVGCDEIRRRQKAKAEGVEELVVSPFDEDRMRESMPGIVPQDGPSDMDAPQTKEKLFQHIVDCNPATFGRPRKPTGEELAEMAEEEGNA